MRDSVSWGRRHAERPKERNPAMEKYRVTLTADERNALEKLVAVGRAAARKLTHARRLLLADTSHELAYRDDQIVLALGTSLRSVERMRKRFVTDGGRPAARSYGQIAAPRFGGAPRSDHRRVGS